MTAPPTLAFVRQYDDNPELSAAPPLSRRGPVVKCLLPGAWLVVTGVYSLRTSGASFFSVPLIVWGALYLLSFPWALRRSISSSRAAKELSGIFREIMAERAEERYGVAGISLPASAFQVGAATPLVVQKDGESLEVEVRFPEYDGPMIVVGSDGSELPHQ